MRSLYLVVYEVGDGHDRIKEVFPAHQAHWQSFVERGELLMIGPYADRSGALAVLTTREAAEEFATNDPFVTENVVGGWRVQEWLEALGEDAAPPPASR